MWPKPRAHRWASGYPGAGQEPDQSDALLFLNEEGFDVAIEDSSPFPVNPLARMHELWSGLDPARTVRLAFRLRRYDVLIGVGEAVASLFVHLKRMFGLRLPVVVIDPALSHDYPRRQRMQDVELPWVQRVVVFGRVQVELLRERYGDRVRSVFIPHRIDTDFYCQAPNDASRSGSPPVVVSVGEDGSRDFETLIRAVAICRRRGRPDLRCVVRTSRALATVSESVDVRTEPMAWTSLRDLYRSAAIVALPVRDSVHAGGINTLLEAMSVGRPVVVSDSRGLRDYVTDGETALVVPPGDPERMADALLRLLDDPGLASRLARSARKQVTAECANRVYARRLATVLREVLSEAGVSTNR